MFLPAKSSTMPWIVISHLFKRMKGPTKIALEGLPKELQVHPKGYPHLTVMMGVPKKRRCRAPPTVDKFQRQ